MTDARELLDISEAAAFLNVSETSLRRWTNSGRLACLRVGQRRERRFRRTDLVAFLEDQRVDGALAPERARSGRAPNKVEDGFTVTQRSHLCALYGTDVGRVTLAVPFLLEGLLEGSVCFLVGPPGSQKAILKNLKERHPSLDSDLRNRRLLAVEHQKSPKLQYAYFETEMKKAEAAGVGSFRLVGDMWGMRKKISARELTEFEVGLDRTVVLVFPVVILCMHDVRKFSGVEILDALKNHRDTFRVPLGRSLA